MENKTKRTIIPLGPYHPLFEEPEFFTLICEGEKVVDADWRASYNHRGIEKLAENKSWEQITFLVERICGICSTSHPITYVQAVEELANIEIPERAKYIRTIIGELERIHSHLLWIGLAGHFIGYNTLFMWAWKYREPVCQIMELISGNRQNYAMMKIGGVRRDIEPEDIPRIMTILSELEKKVDMITKAIIDDPVVHARTKGVAVLPKEEAIKFCAVGPTARASGIAIDVRKDSPYAAYNLVDWQVITANEGDVFAKAVVRCLELFESIKIVKQCLEKLKKVKGEIAIEVHEIPPGEGIGRHEAPRGEVFHYVRSDGSNRPIRHKIRAPSYMNIPTYKVTVVGGTIADAALALAAVDPCYCCTERMAVVDKKTGNKIFSSRDLIKLSQEKTELIKKELGLDWKYKVNR